MSEVDRAIGEVTQDLNDRIEWLEEVLNERLATIEQQAERIKEMKAEAHKSYMEAREAHETYNARLAHRELKIKGQAERIADLETMAEACPMCCNQPVLLTPTEKGK